MTILIVDVLKDARSPMPKTRLLPPFLPSQGGTVPPIPASFPRSSAPLSPCSSLTQLSLMSPLLTHTHTLTRTHTGHAHKHKQAKAKVKRVKEIAVLVIQGHVESHLISSDQIEVKDRRRSKRSQGAIEEEGRQGEG
jgi:hypothetical protein